jgi:hypothetical protein
MTKRSFSAHCAYVGCPLKNIRCSWCAISPNNSRVLFTVWEDEFVCGRYVIYPTTERRPREIPEEANRRLGAREAERVARYAVENPNVPVYGIVCVAKDPKAKTRQRKTFNEQTLLRLRVVQEERSIIAYKVQDAPTENVAV